MDKNRNCKHYPRPILVSWYQNMISCFFRYGITTCFHDINYFNLFFCRNTINPTSIDVNIGELPVFKSSKTQFWPILFNIAELPNAKPMAIAIFCGETKRLSLEDFFTTIFNRFWNKITVQVRCMQKYYSIIILNLYTRIILF